MATKVGTNLSLDPELKKESIELFSDLGLDLSTAVSIFLRQAIRVQGFPFVITRETRLKQRLRQHKQYNYVLFHYCNVLPNPAVGYCSGLLHSDKYYKMRYIVLTNNIIRCII